MPTILLSSTNQAKNQSIKNFFGSQNIAIDLTSVDVDSRVSKTPNSDDEGIQGCINRINNSKKQFQNKQFDYCIGMEGIITTNQFGTFLCGWVCIESKLGSQFFGCSAKCQIPPQIAKNILTFGELSALIKEYYAPELVSQHSLIGTNGIITNNLYNRVDEFCDSLKCAWGYMNH